MSIVIKQLEAADYSRWDDFVLAAEEGTFFHLSGWKDVIEQSFNHPVTYFYSERDGKITGVLPLVEVKSWLFGHSLVSTPFCVYGGVVAADAESKKQLLDAAKELAVALDVDYLELRHKTAQTDGWPSKSVHAGFVKVLDADPEVNMKAMKRKQRAVIRQGVKNEHEVVLGETMSIFYDLYATSVRNLGTPVFSLKFFKLLKQVFADQCEVLSVRQNGRPMASLMSFYFKDQVLPYYAGSVPESRNLKSMDFMYWEQMCRAREAGYQSYDFGRSKIDSGPYNYKRHWGFEPQALCYEYYLVNADELPDINPNNPKYKLFIDMWKRLPLGLSKLLGPLLSRYLG